MLFIFIIFSCCFVNFYNRPDDLFLAVGVAKDMCIKPRSASGSAILLFHVDPHSGAMTLSHTTIIDAIPSAVTAFGGRLLAGVGSVLRLYDVGKKQLLRKCEARIPTMITALDTQGWRVFAGDNSYSLLIFQYQTADNRFVLVADDLNPRAITCLLPLDYETVAIADRMGNFTVLRLTAAVAEDLENDTRAGVVLAKRGHLFGAPHKLERLAEFYLGDTIMSLKKCSMWPGARELVLYTTISGAYGVFLPFAQRQDALFCQNLEMRMRSEAPAALLGRDHLTYRSYYAAVKSVIDGDLCEEFTSLEDSRQQSVANDLGINHAELMFKLEELRTAAGL